jgi:outer membrane protein OmpA-like peptidoglycan-associated protein
MVRFIALTLMILSFSDMKAQSLTADPDLIKSIYFGGGSYYISGEQQQSLAEFIKGFPNIENYKITVHSYTDDIGGVEFNQMLSEMRSQMAIYELLELNISRELIEVHDFGEYNPVYDNTTLEGRLMNRRVDVILWPVEIF